MHAVLGHASVRILHRHADDGFTRWRSSGPALGCGPGTAVFLEISIAKRAIVAAQTTGMPYRQVFQSMRNNAEEAGKNAANAWSNPTLNNDSKGVGMPGQPLSAALAASANRPAQPASRPSEKKSWWQKLMGK
jgi:hypothetical protein